MRPHFYPQSNIFFMFFRHLRFALLLSVYVHMVHASEKVPMFAYTNMSEARSQASVSGKLIWVDFYASWCKPCQWMQSTTYQDVKVKNALESDFITVKINIDDAEGYELKKVYDITYLPTLLIFNAEGDLLHRVERTLSPHTLLDITQTFKSYDNSRMLRYGMNTSPHDAEGQPASLSGSVRSNSMYDDLHNSSGKRPLFKVQVGVFSSYQLAENMVKDLRKFFDEPVTVSYEYENNTPVFKIHLGQFSTREDAEFFINVMRNDYNMDGIVMS